MIARPTARQVAVDLARIALDIQRPFLITRPKLRMIAQRHRLRPEFLEDLGSMLAKRDISMRDTNFQGESAFLFERKRDTLRIAGRPLSRKEIDRSLNEWRPRPLRPARNNRRD